MRNIVLLLLLCFGTGALLCAQTTATEMEQLLGTEAVTYEQAAWFLLRAAEVPASNPAGAFNYAAEKNWLPKKVSPNDPARLDGVALLVMRSFDIKGGIIYSLYQTPHYAYRELVYKSIIQGRTDPAMSVSGDILLFITGKALTQGNEEN